MALHPNSCSGLKRVLTMKKTSKILAARAYCFQDRTSQASTIARPSGACRSSLERKHGGFRQATKLGEGECWWDKAPLCCHV